TGWPIIAAVAAGISVIGIIWVATASAGWTNSNRYARTAEAAEGEFDSAATWDALSRGEDIVDDAGSDPGDGDVRRGRIRLGRDLGRALPRRGHRRRCRIGSG